MRTVTLTFVYDVDDDELTNDDAARLAGDMAFEYISGEVFEEDHPNVEIEFPEGLTADDFPLDPDAPEVITFRWSRNHGDCVDCGRPAAFKSSRYVKSGEPQVPEERARLCALCAANDAADGMVVRRIEEPD